MNILMETLKAILVLGGLFVIVYVLAYAIELAKYKVRRKMHVCDNCYERIKKIKDL